MAGTAICDLRDLLERAVLAYTRHRDEGDETHADYDASLWHQADGVALAARDLVRAIDAQPAGQRPVGWDEHSNGPFSTEPSLIPQQHADLVQRTLIVDLPKVAEWLRSHAHAADDGARMFDAMQVDEAAELISKRAEEIERLKARHADDVHRLGLDINDLTEQNTALRAADGLARDALRRAGYLEGPHTEAPLHERIDALNTDARNMARTVGEENVRLRTEVRALSRSAALVTAEAERDRLARIVSAITALTRDTDGNDLDPDVSLPVGEFQRVITEAGKVTRG